MPDSIHHGAILHTSDAHVARFTGLLDQAPGELLIEQRVHPSLLELAQRDGWRAESVHSATAEVIRGFKTQGFPAVVCTCSTIGPVADIGIPVFRIDRPMMREAITRGGRICVLAALESTREPTLDLLMDEAQRQSRSPSDCKFEVVPTAWSHFSSGDNDAYLRSIATAINAIDPDHFDICVLAQVSMADAAQYANARIPILTSPISGLQPLIKKISDR